MNYKGNIFCDDYEESGYKFMGLVNMNDYEPDMLLDLTPGKFDHCALHSVSKKI